MITNRVFIYSLNKKKEIVEEVDTSTFFRSSNIKDVKECSRCLQKIVKKYNLINGIIKADINILYNNITMCDIKELYRLALEPLDFNKITYTPIEELLNTLSEPEKIIYYDGEVYTSFYKKKKSSDIKDFSNDIVVVGNIDSEYMHYSSRDLIWEMYKRSFTKD